MLHHRGFKSILIGLCLVLLTTGGLFTIVGSGGSSSDPDPEGSMRTFMNNGIRCGASSANTQITINGQVMNTSSGNFSGCVSMPPGTYQTHVRLSTPAGCPTRNFYFNMSIVDGCTTNLSLDRTEGNATRLFFTRGSACPGACRSKVKDGEESDLLEETFEVVASEDEEANGYDW